MNGASPHGVRLSSALGCLCLALALFFLCLMPLALAETMRAALDRLHLGPAAALLAVIGIFVGSLVNLPVYRVRREKDQPVELA